MSINDNVVDQVCGQQPRFSFQAVHGVAITKDLCIPDSLLEEGILDHFTRRVCSSAAYCGDYRALLAHMDDEIWEAGQALKKIIEWDEASGSKFSASVSDFAWELGDILYGLCMYIADYLAYLGLTLSISEGYNADRSVIIIELMHLKGIEQHIIPDVLCERDSLIQHKMNPSELLLNDAHFIDVDIIEKDLTDAINSMTFHLNAMQLEPSHLQGFLFIIGDLFKRFSPICQMCGCNTFSILKWAVNRVRSRLYCLEHFANEKNLPIDSSLMENVELWELSKITSHSFHSGRLPL